MRSRALLFGLVCALSLVVSVQVFAQSFATAVAYGSGGNGPNAVAVADVNGDSVPDLVVANWCTDGTCVASSVAVLLGNGDGTYKPAVTYDSGGLYADAVAIADVDGKNGPDIIIGNCGFPKVTQCANGSVAVLLNNGDGTFSTALRRTLSGAGAASVAIADVDGDGKLDVLVATGSASGGFVDVLLGNGDGTLKPPVQHSTGGFTALSVVVADVSGDTLPDLIIANWCPDSACTTTSTVGVLLNSPGGIFQPAVPYPSGGFNSNSVIIEDVNGDGQLDVVVGNGSTTGADAGNVGVLLGNGGGTFQPVANFNRGGYGAGSLAVMDVNGDSKPDLVVANCSTSAIGCANSNGDLTVLVGNGDGTFQTPVAFGSGGSTPFGVAVGDVNGDSKPDIVAANCSSNQCGTGAGGVGVLLYTPSTATTTALTSSLNPSKFGQAVTFTATVTKQPGFTAGPPTGTVSFLNGTTSIGSSPLNSSGVATLPTSALPLGTDTITAKYSGDTNFSTSTSPGVQQVVQAGPTPDYTVSANPTSATVNAGTAANYVITLTPSNGYDGTVTIACPTSLPAGVTCNTPTIAPGKTQATLTVSTTAPSAALMTRPEINSHEDASNLWASLGGFGLIGMILAGDWKKRNRRGMWITFGILAVVMILALAGCGGGSGGGGGGGGGGGTPANTYPLQVVATGTAGTNNGSTAPHPIPVTLVVK
jgi:hypothetical protein